MHGSKPYPDLNEVQGQLAAKRALLIAAAGAHNLFRLCNNAPSAREPDR
jgi:magnesium chelatase family protein